MRVIDLTGQQFGRLTVAERTDNDKYGKAVWICECECGNVISVSSNALISKKKQSCGCLHKDVMRQLKEKNNSYDLSGEYGIGWTTNTNQQFIFDLEDYEKIKDYCWIESDSGYVVASVRKFTGENKIVRFHRLITNFAYDIVDHINCNKMDNRKVNLRLSTKQLNNINRSVNANNKLGIKGVFQCKNGSYIAKIQKGDKIYTKTDKNLDKVIEWRKMKEIELYGEYAYGGV